MKKGLSVTDRHSGHREFTSWRSYWQFVRLVKQSRRYVWDDQVQRFLNTVLATNRNRDFKIPAGSVLFRAQVGIEHITRDDGTEEDLIALSADRMKPLRRNASEGRANPTGIPVLYLASTIQTAISEVRPWIGSEISAARFRTIRDLTAIDLSVQDGKSSLEYLSWSQLFTDTEPDAKTKEFAVWCDIDNAFSRPVSLDEDPSDYVPTQILSELFLNSGYDAIIYRSRFGENSYNIAVYDIEDAEIIECAPYEVSGIEVMSSQIGNAWYPASSIADSTGGDEGRVDGQ